MSADDHERESAGQSVLRMRVDGGERRRMCHGQQGWSAADNAGMA
jgi:hypothetical protein